MATPDTSSPFRHIGLNQDTADSLRSYFDIQDDRRSITEYNLSDGDAIEKAAENLAPASLARIRKMCYPHWPESPERLATRMRVYRSFKYCVVLLRALQGRLPASHLPTHMVVDPTNGAVMLEWRQGGCIFARAYSADGRDCEIVRSGFKAGKRPKRTMATTFLYTGDPWESGTYRRKRLDIKRAVQVLDNLLAPCSHVKPPNEALPSIAPYTTGETAGVVATGQTTSPTSWTTSGSSMYAVYAPLYRHLSIDPSADS